MLYLESPADELSNSGLEEDIVNLARLIKTPRAGRRDLPLSHFLPPKSTLERSTCAEVMDREV